MIFQFIVETFSACVNSVYTTLSSIEIVSGASLWHFTIILLLVGVLVSVFVRNGKA